MPNFATLFNGRRYTVTRRGPDGESTHKVWAMDPTDVDCRFDRGADIRPGDIVAFDKYLARDEVEFTVDQVIPSIDRRFLRVTWRQPGGGQFALALSDLHPEVQKAALRLYTDGHYSNAIDAAAKALNLAVIAKSGSDQSGKGLMSSTFGESGLLDIRTHDGQTGEDEQEGFRFLFMGVAVAFRNPRAHEFIDDDPVSAFEHLALISLLFRRLEEAKKRRVVHG